MILLAHSNYIAKDPKQQERMKPYSPLSTLIAAALLRREGHEVALFDATFADGIGAFESRLDELQPDPPLFPADAAARGAVEAAELWGEETLQPVPRRLSWWALRRDRRPMRGMAQGARLHVPLGLAVRSAQPIVWVEARINGANDVAIKADLAALPAMLDRVDALLGEGVLGGRSLNAADYQIATSVRLLLCFDDLRAAIDRRPAGDYARAVVRDFPGVIPSVLPAVLIADLH